MATPPDQNPSPSSPSAPSALVALFRERATLVRLASEHKTSHAAVQAPARVAEVIANVRAAAESGGLDPGGIERAYRTVIGLFVAFEAGAFESRPAEAAAGTLSLAEIR